MNQNFKKIQVVPTSTDFIDIIFSKTQRKTPTVVHKGYHIGRIRNFYMRKVKFAQDAFEEKLQQILVDFPKIEDVHPFYADLMNVLYDKDHYKLALGQLHTAKHLIDHVAKEYVKLIKFGDSLYRCKCLKRAALGRMATIMKRQRDSLAYLEQIRQHLSRLPSIDPNTRTLLICGYPNVGKSSFMNKVTRADVEVQPYAFTTKSLFVGCFDYKYLRWQVIDTPGILDRPLEERNTIEMQSITALAHIRACILYFIDFSENCGYTLVDQIKLFNHIKPLFANKPILIVANKSDLKRFADVPEEEQALINDIIAQGQGLIELVESSNMTEDGLMNVRNVACEKLLAQRVDYKLKGNKVTDVLNRLHLTVPKPRDDKVRAPFIPENVKNRVRYEKEDPERPMLEVDLELQNGGPGVYNIDLKKKYMLTNPDWKYDIIPEIMDGKNVADFVDPEIEARLEQLEREEEERQDRGEYDSEEEDDETVENRRNLNKLANEVSRAKKVQQLRNRLKRTKSNPTMPGKAVSQNMRARAYLASRKAARPSADNGDEHGEHAMDIDKPSGRNRSQSRAVGRSQSVWTSERDGSRVRARSMVGLKDGASLAKSEKLRQSVHKRASFSGKMGDADRHIATVKPKHLFAGKRKNGTNDRR